ncbi:MAG: metallophosphoesterase [Ruminococcus sp.]|nr:metallophosphoesterase [Candidatus Copronaster equi]
MNIIKIVIAFFLSLSQFINPLFAFMNNGGIDNFYEDWSAETKYTEDYAVTLEKNPDKDFVVLNFSDIQLVAKEIFGKEGQIAEETITKAIQEVQPDLITLTGDNSWCRTGYIRLCKFLDTFKIPWAAVMGNHDGGSGDKVYENWCGYQMYNSKYGLFKFGPKDMGVGNYVINITENGKIIHSLYMMDTHTDTQVPVSSYDHLWANQLEWYKWAVKGNNAIAGKTVESTIFFHIPCIEYRYAWEAAKYNPATGVYENPKYADSFGMNEEVICSCSFDSGIFSLAKELGSTKNIISGHDHTNSSSIMYDGIRLSYSLKCSPGGYWEPYMNGGSTLTIGSDGHATFAHHYVDPMSLSLDNQELILK